MCYVVFRRVLRQFLVVFFGFLFRVFFACSLCGACSLSLKLPEGLLLACFVCASVSLFWVDVLYFPRIFLLTPSS